MLLDETILQNVLETSHRGNVLALLKLVTLGCSTASHTSMKNPHL